MHVIFYLYRFYRRQGASAPVALRHALFVYRNGF